MAKGLLQKRHFILDYIRRAQAVSRHQIARRFEMNPSTVGNIVEGLVMEGLVLESSERPPGSRQVGRPPIMLSINPDAGTFVGLDMYRDRLTAALTDFTGKPLRYATRRLPRDADRDRVLAALTDVTKAVADSAPRDSLRAIGAGLPGLVDRASGVGTTYHLIREWKQVPVADILASRFGLPAFVEHNSNTLALAEASHGAASRYDHVAVVLVRTGVSLGVVRHGAISSTSPVGAGELGHAVVRVDGPRCWCGNRGCLECFVSGWALEQRIAALRREHPDWEGSGTEGADAQACAELLVQRAASGDRLAETVLNEMFRYLGAGVNTVIRLFAPDVVVISGIFSSAGDAMRQIITGEMGRARFHPATTPAIIIAGGGNTSGAAGAALMAAFRWAHPVQDLQP